MTTTLNDRAVDDLVPAPPRLPDLAAIAAIIDPVERAVAAENARQLFEREAAGWCRTVRNRGLAEKLSEPGVSLAKLADLWPWRITRQRLHSMAKEA